MSFRGFRFQTGEIAELAQELRDKGFAKADIDHEDEVSVYIEELEKENILQRGERDEDAVDRVSEPEFYARYFFAEGEREYYLDIYLMEEEEEDYDGIFWG